MEKADAPSAATVDMLNLDRIRLHAFPGPDQGLDKKYGAPYCKHPKLLANMFSDSTRQNRSDSHEPLGMILSEPPDSRNVQK